MCEDLQVLVPAFRDDASREGLFSRFDPGVRVLPAGFQVQPRFMPLPVDVVFEKDVAVTLRDGVTIYVDVLRPASDEKVPVLVAWSPYGKSRGNASQYVELYGMLGMDTGKLSGLHKFEGPDPAFWCAHGYAVCTPDPRGSYNSEGDLRWWSRLEGEDYHDLIEWLGVQDWCSGKVGTTGNSYLCISQWFAAAEQPPHLAAIAPWEGMSDVYRDLVMRGGIPDPAFAKTLASAFVGKNLREDLALEAERHPLMDALWESKIPAFEKIAVPAYVTASYSNSIHTPGTFRAWRSIASQEKWLRIHNSMEWPDYYEEANVQDLRRFFDHYLKGVDNGWEQTPRVRYALLDLEGGDRVDQPAGGFPPQHAVEVKYYLDAAAGALQVDPPAASVSVSYAADDEGGQASFTLRVDSPTAFVGYPKVCLWVEADGSDDMDLFVFLQKLDAGGEPLEQFNIPHPDPKLREATETGAPILKSTGSNGRLRASMRRLDGAKSTDANPVHRFDNVEKLAPGEVVFVEIDLFPVGLGFYAGEGLRLVVSGHNIFGGAMPGTENVSSRNSGQHIVHSGGERASYLSLMTMPISPL